jgi:hypothetical protein
VISAGFALALVITVPMGIFNLDDNMIIQSVAFVITIVCWIIWFVACFFSESFSDANGTHNWTIPAIKSGESWTSQAGVLGNILFNFGFVTTVPSWVNEKKPGVNLNKAVWLSSFLCIVIFFAIGIPGCMAFQDYLQGPATGSCKIPGESGCKVDIMSVLTDPNLSPKILYNNPFMRNVMVWSVYLFPIVAVMSSIPVFSIVIKYNCLENGFGKSFSVFWGVIFPWIVALPISYQPDALNNFINFSSLVFVSFTDFIVPWSLYVVLQRRKTHSKSDVSEVLLEEATGEYSLLDSFEQTVNRDKEEAAKLGTVAHWALPPSWKIKPCTKIIVAIVFVVLMTIGCLVATTQSIQQTSSSPWVCSNVSGF